MIGGKEGRRGRWKMGNRIKGGKGQEGEDYTQFHRGITRLPAAPVSLGSLLLPDSRLHLLPSSSSA